MCWSENQRQIDVLSLRISEVLPDLQNFAVANHLIDRPESQLGHDSTHLVRNIVEEIDDVLRRAFEFLPEFRVLSCDTDRTSVQVARF